MCFERPCGVGGHAQVGRAGGEVLVEGLAEDPRLRLAQDFSDVVFHKEDLLADALQAGLVLHLLEATATGGQLLLGAIDDDHPQALQQQGLVLRVVQRKDRTQQ